MEVILLERIRKLGQMGDVVRVKNGFARNFLLPQNKALRATDANKKQFEAQKAQLEARNLESRNEAEAVREKVDGRSFILLRQAGESGQLYGSVTTRDISDLVTKGGVEISRNQVNLDKPIKEIGLHPIEIILHADVLATITLNVARTEDEAGRQARGENVLAERTDEEEARIEAEALFENPEAALEIEAESETE